MGLAVSTDFLLGLLVGLLATLLFQHASRATGRLGRLLPLLLFLFASLLVIALLLWLIG